MSNRQYTVDALQVTIIDGGIAVSFVSFLSVSVPTQSNLPCTIYDNDDESWFIHHHHHHCYSSPLCVLPTNISATATFSLYIRFIVDPVSCLVSFNADESKVQVTNIIVTGCPGMEITPQTVSPYISKILDELLGRVLQDVIKQEITTNFFIPAETSLGNNIFIGYRISSLVIVPNEIINVTVNTRVNVQQSGTNVTYNDTIPERKTLRPPLSFSTRPTANDYITADARISDALLHGIIWGLQLSGFRTATGSISILDANISILLEWNNIDFIITEANLMEITIDVATVRGSCNDKPLVLFTVSNLSGSAHLVPIQNTTTLDTGLYISLDEWYDQNLHVALQLPEVMLPDSFITDLVRTALKSCIADFNFALSTQIVWLPTSIAPYTPNAQVHLVHQDGCCNGTHGFIEFTTACSCDVDPGIWTPCGGNLCPSSPSDRGGAAAGTQGASVSSQKLPDPLLPAQYLLAAASAEEVAAAPGAASSREKSNSERLHSQRAQNTTYTPTTPTTALHPLVLALPAHQHTQQLHQLRKQSVGTTMSSRENAADLTVLFNRDGSQALTENTAVYSYVANGSCVLNFIGTYEQLSLSQSNVPGSDVEQSLVNFKTGCFFRNCTVCQIELEGAPLNAIISTPSQGTVEVTLSQPCIDFGGSVYDLYRDCVWLYLNNILITSKQVPMNLRVLLCSDEYAHQYNFLSEAVFAIVTNATIFFGCSSPAISSCTMSTQNYVGCTQVPNSTMTARVKPYCGSQPTPQMPGPVDAINMKLLIILLPVCMFVAIGITIILIVHRNIKRRRRELVSLSRLLWKGCRVVASRVAAYLSSKRRRPVGLRNSISWCLLSMSAALWLHYWMYTSSQPLGLFGRSNLAALGFSSEYISLDKYDDAINKWQSLGDKSFLGTAVLVSLCWMVNVIFKVNPIVLIISIFLQLLGFMLVYLIYPLTISFSYLIVILPGSNVYLHDHPDTLATFSSLIGNGLSGIAIAFLTNITLLLFSSMCVGALLSSWVQHWHEDVTVDTFLAMLCAMVPFVVLVPAMVLYHAISQQSTLWVGAWICMFAGLICGIAFLMQKLRDPHFHEHAERRLFNQYFVIFGTCFIVFGCAFVLCSLWVERNYNLISIGYLLTMILAAGLGSFSLCFTLRLEGKHLQIRPPQWRYSASAPASPSINTVSSVNDQAGDDSEYEEYTGSTAFGSDTEPLMLKRDRSVTAIVEGLFESETRLRLLFLFVGVPLTIAVTWHNYSMYEGQTARSVFNDVLQQFAGTALIFPSSGKTILDPCFSEYDTVRGYQIIFNICGCACFTLAFVIHLISYACTSKTLNGKTAMLRLSQITILVGVLFTTGSVLSTSVPDYLSLANVGSLCPSCGAQFDVFVQSSVNLTVALIQMLISVLQTTGLIMALIPTFNRVLYTRIRMVRASHRRDSSSKAADHKEKNLRHICIVVAFMSMFITSLPLLVLRQLSPDDNLGLALLIPAFWILPGLYLALTRSIIRSATLWYLSYVVLYFSLLIGIVLVVLHNQMSYIVSTYLEDPYFYVAVFASITISSVAIGDAFQLMFGNFEHLIEHHDTH